MFGLMGVARMSGQPGGAWSPLRLFANSEEGVWYDPSDFSTMFQDSTGTTPVTAVEQPVGLILDKSGNGNHATQATAAARPVVSARKNWLTYTEDLTNAAWATVNGATTSTSAFTFVNSNSYIQHDTYTVSGVVTGSTVTLSLTLSADTAQTLRLVIVDGGDGVPAYPLDVNVTTTPTRFEHTATLGAGFSGNLTIQLLGNSVISAGTVVTVSEPQLETGSTATTYQRVTTASDYDTVGFPHYLAFDGIDDVLVTAAIDMGKAMTVFAGIDASYASLYGAIWTNVGQGTDGKFDLAVYENSSNTAGYMGTGYAAFMNVLQAGQVLTAQTDKNGSVLADLRRNGVAAGTVLATAGSAYTGAWRLGATAGGQFVGPIYSLVARAANSTAAEITATEAYIARKSGVTL